ncbi:hypothetical protein V8C34DRAFT_322539 [Trichoderma compactum]
MHGVYSQLNRLRLGAVDLEDGRLQIDSLNGLQYIYMLQGSLDGLETTPSFKTSGWGFNVSPNLELSVARPPAYYEYDDVNNVRGALRDRRPRVNERVRSVVFRARARNQGATHVVPRRRPVLSIRGPSRAALFSVIGAGVDDTGNEGEPEDPIAPDGDPFNITAPEVVADVGEKPTDGNIALDIAKLGEITKLTVCVS